MISASVSDRGLSQKRPQNEDSFLELRDIGLFAVADGVGGARAGDVASQTAVEVLADAFRNQQRNTDSEEVMKLALERANSAIYQMAADLPQLASMATTIVALQISGGIATIGHVGDSRLYRIDTDGRLHRETADHSVVEEEVRAGRMTAEQALNHPSRNVISRALGADASVMVDLKTIMVDPGTTFLLCSDGVTRHIDDGELEDLFALEDDAERLTVQIRDLCYSRGAEDNLTAVVVRVPTTAENGFAADKNGTRHEAEFHEAADNDLDTIASTCSVSETSAARVVNTLDTDEENQDDEYYLSDDLSPSNEVKSGKDFAGYTSSSLEVSAAVPAGGYRPVNTSQPTVLPAGSSSNPALSRIGSSVLLLLTGVLLGVAAYYFLAPVPPQPLPPPAPVLVQKSPDVSLTAFEEGRRLIDSDPAGFISANAASPQSAEDYFLLGRAFLLNGKYWEAKRAFIEAKNRLSQADPKNAKILVTEIAMAMALIQSPGAAEAFSKEVNTARAGASPVSDVNRPAPALPAR